MNAPALQPLLHQVSYATQSYGVLGLGIGMFFESLGIPFASAVVALTAGTLIASGKTSFLQALLISTAGLTLGSLVSYYIGYFSVKLGKKLRGAGCAANSHKEIFAGRLERFGEVAILLAQLFGTTRTWISLPAGAMRINLRKFVTYTAIGGAIYCALSIGFSLALNSVLSRMFSSIDPVTYLLLLAVSLAAAAFASAVYFVKSRKKCAGGR